MTTHDYSPLKPHDYSPLPQHDYSPLTPQNMDNLDKIQEDILADLGMTKEQVEARNAGFVAGMDSVKSSKEYRLGSAILEILDERYEINN